MAYGTFAETIFWIATSDESHLGKNDNSIQAPALGGFLSDFRPLQLRGIFAFSILRLYGTFVETISLNRQSRWVTSWQNDNSVQAPTVGGFLPDFRPLQLRGLFAFPIFRFLRKFRQKFFRIITSDESHLFQIFAHCNCEGLPKKSRNFVEYCGRSGDPVVKCDMKWGLLHRRQTRHVE